MYEQNKYSIHISSPCFRVFQCFGRLQVLENEISLCKWSVGTAQFHTLEAGAGPAGKFRVGFFSGSQFHNGFATARRDDVHFTTLL